MECKYILSDGVATEGDGTTDISLVVDETCICFYKTLLSVASPVFSRMFTANFKEKSMETIDLPGKNVDGFVKFLMELHPAHAWKPITESDLEPLLKLADEYGVKHITRKCEHFVLSQLQFTQPLKILMRYLWLSITYQLTEVQSSVLPLIVDHTLDQLEGCKYYEYLSLEQKLTLTRMRCKHVEDEKMSTTSFQLFKTGRSIRDIKTIVHRLPGLLHSLPQKCPGTDTTTSCVPCSHPRCTGDWCTLTKDTTSLQRHYCSKCIAYKAGIIVSELPSEYRASERR